MGELAFEEVHALARFRDEADLCGEFAEAVELLPSELLREERVERHAVGTREKRDFLFKRKGRVVGPGNVVK